MVALGGGCIFSPHKDDDPPKVEPPPEYPPRDTPAHAVYYLSLAWSARDSVRVDSVYADDYEGTSVDLVDPAAPSFIFYKIDEVRSVGRIARAPEVTRTKMDLKHPNTWIEGHYASDPPDYRYVQVPGFTIELHVLGTGGESDQFIATSPWAGETWIFEFTLRPTYPAWANGAPVYEIVKWVESRSTN